MGLHAGLGGMLLLSVDFNMPVEAPVVPNVQPIQAQVVDAKQVQEHFDRKEAQRQAAENEKRRKIEEKKRKERKAAEARKKKAEREKAEKERKRKEKERKEREAEQKRQEEIRKENERKEKLRKEQERKERLEQERIMQEQLEAEQADMRRRNSRKVASEVDKYMGLIDSRINQYWAVDNLAMKGMTCRLNVKLASNGLVLSVTRLSGDDLICRSAENAIYKAETLPVSDDPEVFNKLKDINLTFSK